MHFLLFLLSYLKYRAHSKPACESYRLALQRERINRRNTSSLISLNRGCRQLLHLGKAVDGIHYFSIICCLSASLQRYWWQPHTTRAQTVVGAEKPVGNNFPGGSSQPQQSWSTITVPHFSKECGTFSCHFLSQYPTRDSDIIHELYELLGIECVWTSIYNLEIKRLVEQLNKALKLMFCKLIHKDEQNWNRWLEPVMFAVQEVPEDFTGFSPFELLFSKKLWEVSVLSRTKNTVRKIQAHLRMKVRIFWTWEQSFLIGQVITGTLCFKSYFYYYLCNCAWCCLWHHLCLDLLKL